MCPNNWSESLARVPSARYPLNDRLNLIGVLVLGNANPFNLVIRPVTYAPPDVASAVICEPFAAVGSYLNRAS